MNIKTVALILVIIISAVSIYYLESRKTMPSPKESKKEAEIKLPMDSAAKKEKAKIYKLAKEITSPDGFINISDDFTIKDLIGKK